MGLFVLRYCPVSIVLIYSFVISEVSPFSDEGWERKEKLLDENLLREIFLENLGLSRVPNVSMAETTESEMKEMLALYERSLREDDNVNPAYYSDVQRLYTFKDNAPKTEKRDVHLLSFPLNIDNTTRSLSVRSAKLYIHKKGKRDRRGTAALELYQLMESSILDDPQSLLIERRRVGFSDDGWEEFNVTEVVASWFGKPSSNHGFLIKCKECSRRRMILVTANTDRDSDNRARLDVSVGASSPGIKRHSRRFAIESEEEEEQQQQQMITKGGENNNLCCRHPMWISFKEMSWNWVLQPKGFHAYYCKGKCTHDYFNYANAHALLQSIVNWRYDKSIPQPCCVPKTLKSLRLLHYTDNDPPKLILTKQTGMIAETCGCA